jgi:hypothetical protein
MTGSLPWRRPPWRDLAVVIVSHRNKLPTEVSQDRQNLVSTQVDLATQASIRVVSNWHKVQFRYIR